MDIVGDGTVGGIVSAAIDCVPSAQNANQAAILLIYMGTSLVAQADHFTGVLAGVPNDPGLLSPNALFFVAAATTSVTITGSSFTNIANSYSPLITFEQGVNGVVYNCLFQGNSGQLHGTVAVSSLMHVDVINSQFISNTCTCGGSFDAPCSDSSCHNAAIYVTEGASATVSGSNFANNVGHFGTALLVTSGASFDVSSSTFTGNQHHAGDC
ncbi:hypothetical protein WJX72_009101 [[Myrmecia] bisecta]|uniref:Uncharacterized protein n=1 Tax=[Myrmecia] bisecta TaxID=41462 RepID=A0AAW1P931_9CHLO